VIYPRRLVFIGTTNHAEFLDDETGARRWLPVNCSRADAAYVQEVRDQLWAEGLAIYRAEGVAWQGAQMLAEARHGAFRVSDDWAEPLAAWLTSPEPHMPGRPVEAPRARQDNPVGVAAHDVAREALGIDLAHLDPKAQKRLAKVLHALGFHRRKVRIGGKTPWRWFPEHPAG
jgi:predicted P-loop ATPase